MANRKGLVPGHANVIDLLPFCYTKSEEWNRWSTHMSAPQVYDFVIPGKSRIFRLQQAEKLFVECEGRWAYY